MIKRQKFLSRSTLDFEVEKNTTELIYLSEKLKHLESLAKQHPDDQKSSYQISDYSESSTKYLPVTTQIIGVKRDIYEKKEALDRLNDKVSESKNLESWIADGDALFRNNFNGLEIADKLLGELSRIDSLALSSGIKKTSYLKRLSSELKGFKNDYERAISATSLPRLLKPNPFKWTILGAAFGVMLMTLLMCIELIICIRKNRSVSI